MSSVVTLCGRDGALVTVSIGVDPRHLESLLEALAQVSFPINPQIYHDTLTRVEFPAYDTQLDEVRRALKAYGFDPQSVQIEPMLDTIHKRGAAAAS